MESSWFEGATFVFVVVNMGLLASYRYDHTKVHKAFWQSAEFPINTQITGMTHDS